MTNFVWGHPESVGDIQRERKATSRAAEAEVYLTTHSNCGLKICWFQTSVISNVGAPKWHDSAVELLLTRVIPCLSRSSRG